MDITLNIVLEALGLSANSDTGFREFERVILAMPKETEADASALYICDAAHAAANCLRNPDVIFLCPRSEAAMETLPNLYQIPGEANESMLFRKVQEGFHKIQAWNKAMHISLIQQRGLQDLMTLSEPIIKNSIHITDSAFTLVACTNGIVPLDPAIKKLRARGGHDSEFVQKIGGPKGISTWAKYNDIGVVHYPKVSPFDMVYKVHHFQYTYYNHTVMVCDHVPYSPAIKDLFAMLVENLSVAIEANWNRERQQQTHSALFSALLDGERNGDNLELLTAQADLPMVGNYMLLQCKPLFGMPMVRVLRELSELLPNALVSEFNGAPVALLNFTGKKEPLDDAAANRLEEFLHRYDLTCAASEAYEELGLSRMAYRQTSLVLQIDGGAALDFLGTDLNPNGRYTRIRNFGKNSVYYLLGGLSAEDRILWQKSRYGRIVEELLQSDQARQTRGLRLLYTFLNSDRNATVTAQLLHMHRNNVTYHIEKLQDRFGIDLEDPGTRFQLLASCILMAFSVQNGTNI